MKEGDTVYWVKIIHRKDNPACVDPCEITQRKAKLLPFRITKKSIGVAVGFLNITF